MYLSARLLLGACCASQLLPLVTGLSEEKITSDTWVDLPATDGKRFSSRNCHATTVYDGRIWLTGGRSDSYTRYDLSSTYRNDDVWYTRKSTDLSLPDLSTVLWVQVGDSSGAVGPNGLYGDYYVQNYDAVQPSSIAPWYSRYGHTLDAIDTNSDGDDDMMIQIGGFNPAPANDIWMTKDGVEWSYSGDAPFSPRAFHMSTVFNGKLWIMGGTPLNNEIWSLEKVTKVMRTNPPLTRYMYNNYTYETKWNFYDTASWTPRVGAGLITQWYFNKTTGETENDARPRMVLVGGYGGAPETINGEANELYDGIYCRGEVWVSYDGGNFTLLTDAPAFGRRAWFGFNQMYLTGTNGDVRLDFIADDAPTMFVLGGGNIGQTATSKKKLSSMEGLLDMWYSRDGANWKRINYIEGGGTTGIKQFSSQPWTTSVVDGKTVYLGMWGMTMEFYNTVPLGYRLVLIAGDKTGTGSMTQNVYASTHGIFCDVEGKICDGAGECGETGCTCGSDEAGASWTGERCLTPV